MKSKYLIFISAILIFINPSYAITELIPAAPIIKASSYLLLDYDSGRTLAAHNIDQPIPPASLTKMMTAYVVASELEAGRLLLDEKVTVSEKAWKMLGSRMFIEVGKEVTVGDLLNGVIIQSGNDASVALAEYVSGTEDVFAQVMNQHARRLGMKNTNFTNSTGLPDEQHFTTAFDLALLAVALIRDFPEIYALHAVKDFTFNGIKQQNRNKLLWNDKSVDGIKTGHTEDAGFCLVASAMRDKMRLISIVLGTDSSKAREQSNQALLNYGFRFYETKKIFDAGDTVTTARIWKGKSETVELGLDNNLYVTIPRGQFSSLNKAFDLPKKITAPVKRGEELGNLKLTLAGEEVLNKPLVVLKNINEANMFGRLKDDIRLIFE
ncbi:MAG: D-alanyl-D-alanine carboxypeptidase family protein [Candidatus Neomarinimicrobiota bacterium]